MCISTLHKEIKSEANEWLGSSNALERQFDPIYFMEGPHKKASHIHNFRGSCVSKHDVDVATDITSTSNDHAEGSDKGHSFNDALRVLESRISKKKRPIQNSCATTNRLLDRLNMRPILKRMRFVHIAGTKGKGTTAAYTSALLQAYGIKVGLFTSPHLIDVRERILVDNLMLPQHTFARYLFELHERLEALKYSERDVDRDDASNVTYFSFMFLLSLHIFAAEHVEVAVIEVGIGGRKDATNVIPSEVSVITALGYDHMELLGNTIQLIAHEKAAIMRPNVVCFASPQRDHPEVCSELESVAKATQTPFMFLNDSIFPIKNWPRLAIGGYHAIEDSKLAFMAARQIAGIPPVLPLDEMEKAVLRHMKFSGRSHIIPFGDGTDCVFYLDGAHTVESLEHATRWFLEVSSTSPSDARTVEKDYVSEESRRVLLFFTLRNPRRILKSFMPFVSKFCKTIIAQVPIMKPESLDVATRIKLSKDIDYFNHDGNRINQDFSQILHERLVTTTESWRELYREVPCLPCAQPFCSINDVLNLVLPAASDGEDISKPAQVFVCGSLYIVGNVLQLMKKHTVEKHRMSKSTPPRTCT
ncbi:unnamed protein product [Phytomonas sp. EM1]|nr:unnamed protein product [Phytomonas sp. EM1]|eukprot:CCW60121.1 unnamed protein product [Phytomonas sp. isolate EM1]